MKTLFLILPVIFISCATQRTCNKFFPCQPPQVKDSVVYLVDYATDTVIINIPADTAAIKALVNCDSSGKAQMKPQSIETNGQRTTVSVTNGLLSVRTECKEKELQKIINIQSKMIRAFKNSVQVKNVEYIPMRFKIALYASIPFTLLGLLTLILFLIRQPWRD